MRMCATRADCLAVLTVPEHYREDEAIAHARTLASVAADERALSYAAIYHPWLFVTEDARTAARRVPPDGVACGLLARRALERGAWVAPANEPLRGVVALAPPLAPTRLLDLQRGRINVVRQEPRGFMMLDESTLSLDPELRRINVRRLMILLRRRALQIGARYVFEPNDDGFRRLVQRSFESTLGHLHARGAFAGRTASRAFQVVTDPSLNTPQARDAGRFFVELKVAPSLPLSFLTIRLVQRGDRLQASEER
jgi:phage tail sheath protein FI